MVADRFEKVAKAVDEEVVERDLVPAFVKLVKDTEAEVRSAVAGQIPGTTIPQPCNTWRNFVICVLTMCDYQASHNSSPNRPSSPPSSQQSNPSPLTLRNTSAPPSQAQSPVSLQS